VWFHLNSSRTRSVILLVLFGSFLSNGYAQNQAKPQLRDPEDGKLDLSDWIIEANGFVPIPMLITEPALGGIGGVLGLAFISQVPNSPPNITTGLGGITSNGTWFVGGLHSHNIPEKGIKYRVGAFYSDINISLFRDLPILGEKEFKFNFRALPIFLSGVKQIKSSNWYIGANYLFLWNRVRFTGELPDFVPENEINSNISNLGPLIQFDTRDNIFTPNRGTKFEGSISFSLPWLGSDYEYNRLDLANYSYWSFNPNWVFGIRMEYQQVSDDAPFFLLPAINLRGVPAARYQGRQTILTELENRIDINSRSSIMAFGGLGKAFDGFSNFSDETLVYNLGTGYRYLIARKFGLRMGLDIAFGPDSWGYYIVFGSNWLR